MENVVNKFYTGGMTNFGFGTWNSLRPNPKKNINNNYNNNMEINAPGPNFLKTVRPLSTGVEPIPKTLLSMNNYNNNSNYNPYNSNYQPTGKTYLSPDVLKMQMLEQKIKQLELQNEDDKMNFQNMMQKIQNDNEIDYQNQINKMQQQQLQRQRIQSMNNNNMYQNPYNRNIDDDYELKRLERRRQVQYELEQAREKLNEDDSSSSYENDEDDDEDEESEYNDKKLKKRKLDSLPSSVDRKSSQYSKNNINNGNMNKLIRQSKMISNQNEDTKDFMNQLPKHVALQLQSDNFKVRGNLAYIKNTFREIKDELENKLDHLERAQKLNYESLRNVIDQGGNEKLKASIKKNLDGKDINLDRIKEDEPEYIKELPDMIDKQILENEERRREDELREIDEENNMREDENIILPQNQNQENEKFIPNKVNLPKNNYNNYDFNRNNDKNPYKYQPETINDKTNFRNPIVDRYGNINKNNKNSGKFDMNNMEQSEISNTESEYSKFDKKKNTKSEKNITDKKNKIKRSEKNDEEEEDEDEEEESEEEKKEKSEEKSSERIKKKKLINKPLKLVNGEFVRDDQSEPKQIQKLSRKIETNPYIEENASEPLEKKNAKQKVRKRIEEFAPDSDEEEDEEEEDNDEENYTKSIKNKKINEEEENEEEDEDDEQ